MILNQILSLSKNVTFQHTVNNGIRGSLLMRYTSIINEGSKKNIYTLKSETKNKPKLKASIPLTISTRNTGFFNKLRAQDLWKSMTSVSVTGRKRGRAKGKLASVKNLNKGQIIGVGEENVVFPGLNAPIFSGNALSRIEERPKDETRTKKLEEIRNSMGKYRRARLSPLERGWTSCNWAGRNVGPPISQNEGDSNDFSDFDTLILESKIVKIMTGNLGQKRRSSLFVVSGNKKGCAGFTLVKGNNVNNAIEKARKKVGQFLLYVDICEGDTVYHDFYCEFMYTKIFVKKKPEGYGLRCHRVIKEICKVLGIKNLNAKVEGSKNTQNITKAFFLGLLNQKTYQQMADEKQLYVAKLLPGMPPKIMAAPSNGHVRSSSDYGMGGKVEIERKKFVPFYERLPSWETHLKKVLKNRNHEKIERQLELEYGQVQSFLTEKYPECVPNYRPSSDE
ncbi:28S ribosomal protein S5, mitochondrial [Armadillidium nasatum]|uniref:Small ribosomal subunit protein uS5m n=1 Tax=Armadillidium nasatum TaxID=96803 RepID=A0A5N5SWS1_9CRUS|nr:28S ribosomal protein S5, mitochondrial [Armadillidium nasatum]